MQQVSLSRDVRGRHALQQLVDPKRSEAERDRLIANANGASAVDAVTAAVLMAAIEEHRASGTSEPVEYCPPGDPQTDRTLHNLLGTLPSGCEQTRSRRAPPRDRLAIVPAHQVISEEGIELAVLGLRAIAPYVGLSKEEREIGAAATIAFAANGLRHAPASPCGLILCAGIERESSALIIAAVDMGAGAAESARDVDDLRAAIETSRRVFGGLTQLTAHARRKELDVTLYLANGTGEAVWNGRWAYGLQSHVPGWCSTLTVHRTSPRRKP